MALVFLDVWPNVLLPAHSLSFSMMPVGDFGQPQDVVLFDPDTDA